MAPCLEAVAAVPAAVGELLAEVRDERLHLTAVVLDEVGHALDARRLPRLTALQALADRLEQPLARRWPGQKRVALAHVGRLQLDQALLLEVAERSDDARAVFPELGCGFVAARKPGKLPWEKIRATYELEYGSDSLEIHADAFAQGARVIVLDDVLATGGTAQAKIELVEQLGGDVIGALFVIELTFLNGREKLAGTDVHALIAY